MTELKDVTDEIVYRAAIRWCGMMDRATYIEDIEYFRNNWQSLPGLRLFVEEHSGL